MAARLTVWDGAKCPDVETLAAFLDNRLLEREREFVAGHLAGCEACYFVFTEAARMQTTAPPQATWWTSRRLTQVAAGLAAAASLVLVAWLGVLPWQRSEPQLEGLVAAVGTTRLVEPRLTAGFTYAPLPGTTRTGQPMALTASPDVRIAAAQIDKDTAAETTPPALRARALAALMIDDVDTAVFSLEQAATLDPQNAQVASDLAAAYLVRHRRQGDTTDLSKALAFADRALALAPALAEAQFNRALALERLGIATDARAAWQRYLEIDPDSGWASEARARLGGARPQR